MSKINKIKSRIGRNSFDRRDLGAYGVMDRGMFYRSSALRADHKRNIAKQFGYPETISLQQHYNIANRHGLASNLSYGIVDDCWRVWPTIYDGDEDVKRRADNPTEFEKAIDEHFERLNVWEFIKDLDHKQRPMRYGVISYVVSQDKRTSMAEEMLRLPSIEYLAALRVHDESEMKVETANENPNSINYGQPVTFSARTDGVGHTNEFETQSYTVHASRTYAIGEGAYGNSIFGVPCNEGAFEALMDAMKIRGSSAEGVYQNASNKYANRIEKGTTETEAELIINQMADFDNEVSRSIITTGGVDTIQTSTLTNPENSWNISANEACAHHRKPVRMAIGNQTGERATTEDIRSWNRVIMDRQESFCNKMIKGLIKDWIEKFTFPEPINCINIVWRDLNELTSEQKVDLGVKMMQTNKAARDAGMPPVYSVEYIQERTGAPIGKIIELDMAGEDDEDSDVDEE